MKYVRTYTLAVVLLTSVIPLPAGRAQPPPDYAGSCTDSGCHDTFAKSPVVHSPVASGACDSCHEPSGDDHEFGFVAEGRDLCLECHDEPSGEVEHKVVADGPCTTCHDPHASEAQKLLTAATVGDLCAECHEEVTEDRPFLHGPVAAGGCTACHNAHASDHPVLLFASKGEICVKCHKDMASRMSEKPHRHEPATQDCTTCHDPHGAQNRMVLHDSLPGLCLDCHDAIAEVVEDATVKHDAMTTARSCAGCHDPHASDYALVLVQQPMDLCLSCHDRELNSPHGKLADMRRWLAEHPNHHGPIRDQNCLACHAPHGGEYARLLAKSYPGTFYAAFDAERYGLCFDCHEVEMVEDERTDDATGFRNGDRNLHYLHVNRAPKGRTCRACHDPHASKDPKCIAASVRFGEWMIPIGFRKTDTGGSCQSGCHRLYRYDRNQAVINLPPAEGVGSTSG